MRPYPVAIQMYSLRESAQADLIAMVKQVTSFGYSGIEFAGFYGTDLGELKKVLDDSGLQVPSSHGPLPRPDTINELADQAALLGFKQHVSIIHADGFPDRAACTRSAATVQTAAELAAEKGISLAYHNHFWEYDHLVEGKTPMELLRLEAPAVNAQIDTYWVEVGGGKAADEVRRWAGRVPTLHIKDGPVNREDAMTAVGSGGMQWDEVFAAADEVGVEWIIVELDHCDTDMLAAVRDSIEYLCDKGYGRKHE